MNELGIVLIAGVALALLYAFHLAENQRGVAIQALAARLGFHYIGCALPRSLRLDGTPFDHVSNVWNVIDGEPRGVRVIAFDCQIGAGKGSWRRTVIAVEGGSDLSLLLNPEMTIDSVGQWQILYRPGALGNFSRGGLIQFEELESYLNSIGATALKSS